MRALFTTFVRAWRGISQTGRRAAAGANIGARKTASASGLFPTSPDDSPASEPAVEREPAISGQEHGRDARGRGRRGPARQDQDGATAEPGDAGDPADHVHRDERRRLVVGEELHPGRVALFVRAVLVELALLGLEREAGDDRDADSRDADAAGDEAEGAAELASVGAVVGAAAAEAPLARRRRARPRAPRARPRRASRSAAPRAALRR